VIERTKKLIMADRATVASHMPLYWQKSDANSFSTPPAFVEDQAGTKEDTQSNKNERLRDLAKSCIRKWNVSIKLANVSSRSTLFGFSLPCSKSDVCHGELLEGVSKSVIMKPLLCSAVLPHYVQTGKLVTEEIAAQMDDDGLADMLGTYDCRVTASIGGIDKVPKKEGKDVGSRAKRIGIGRTRLLWSGLRYSTSNKISFTSLLNAEKLDGGSYKRPRDVKVAVRINRQLLMKPIRDDESMTKAKSRPSVDSINARQKPTAPTLTPIKPAILRASLLNLRGSDDDKIVSTAEDQTPSTPDVSHAMCSLDTDGLLKALEKQGKHRGKGGSSKKRVSHEPEKAPASIVHMNYGASQILRCVDPNIICLPLPDGMMRVVCGTNGSMIGSSVHSLLNLASRNEGHVCSVCWSGNEACDVLECIDCGLLVHLECCHDKGKRICTSESEAVLGTSWCCPVCIDPTSILHDSEPPSNADAAAPVVLPSRKSRRTAKVPSRFVESLGVNPNESLTEETQLFHKVNSRGRKSPKCTLCPHSGKKDNQIRIVHRLHTSGELSCARCMFFDMWHHYCRWCDEHI